MKLFIILFLMIYSCGFLFAGECDHLKIKPEATVGDFNEHVRRLAKNGSVAVLVTVEGRKGEIVFNIPVINPPKEMQQWTSLLFELQRSKHGQETIFKDGYSAFLVKIRKGDMLYLSEKISEPLKKFRHKEKKVCLLVDLDEQEKFKDVFTLLKIVSVITEGRFYTINHTFPGK